MFRLFKYSFLVAFIVITSLFCAGFFWWSVPPQQSHPSVEVEVPNGANFAQVASALASKNVVRWPLAFRVYGRLLGEDNQIRSGLYEFKSGLLPAQVMEKLVKGVVVLTEFSHPPGHNMFQVAESLSAAFPDFKTNTWLKLFRDSSFINEVAPGASSLEGYLFPDVYKVRSKATAQEVVKMMVSNFKKHLTPDIVAKGKKLGLSPHQVITLASIIEKETGSPEERPLIAAVFFNRLKIGMRLQTDPTVIYGIWENFDGNLRRRDLENPTPYNTYTISGLPPGPIANPGKEAITAAVHPTQANSLYFVAKGDGTHYFSSSLSEHNSAVRRFQLAPISRKHSP